jgi:hypothetical protein
VDWDVTAQMPGMYSNNRGFLIRDANETGGGIEQSFHSGEKPEHAATIACVLAIPTKRHDRAIVSSLDQTETSALVAARDRCSWIGRRDRVLLAQIVEAANQPRALKGVTVSFRVSAAANAARRTPTAGGSQVMIGNWSSEHRRSARGEHRPRSSTQPPP